MALTESPFDWIRRRRRNSGAQQQTTAERKSFALRPDNSSRFCFPLTGERTKHATPRDGFLLTKVAFPMFHISYPLCSARRNGGEPAASWRVTGGEGGGGVWSARSHDQRTRRGTDAHTQSHTDTHSFKIKNETKERKPEKADSEGGRYGGLLLLAEQQEWRRSEDLWEWQRVAASTPARGGGGGRGLESVVSGQHVFSSAVGLQGFCGVDILRQLRFASHHRPLLPLLVLQLGRDGGRKGPGSHFRGALILSPPHTHPQFGMSGCNVATESLTAPELEQADRWLQLQSIRRLELDTRNFQYFRNRHTTMVIVLKDWTYTCFSLHCLSCVYSQQILD